MDADNSNKSGAPRLGIIGGGQLARMTALAAANLGVEVRVIERVVPCPASFVATEAIQGDWNAADDLLKLAAKVDLLTLENEFVDADQLARVEGAGHVVYPTSATMRLVQDKLAQKRTLEGAGLPIPAMRQVDSQEDLKAAAGALGLPLVLKARRNGYDGKGNFTVRAEADMEAGWRALDGPEGRELYAEAFCPFVKELATIVTRSQCGESVHYPVVETVQKEHICHIVRAPAEVDDGVAKSAADIAAKAIDAIDGVGSFGVEMFLLEDGSIVVNELAPRVHNSGHYTIEACECSQFENHVRAVMDLPRGSTRMVTPAAVMFNTLGDGHGPGHPGGMDAALDVPGAHVHTYGKSRSVPGRKMGHVTALGESVAEAEAKARQAAEALVYGSPD